MVVFWPFEETKRAEREREVDVLLRVKCRRTTCLLYSDTSGRRLRRTVVARPPQGLLPSGMEEASDQMGC